MELLPKELLVLVARELSDDPFQFYQFIAHISKTILAKLHDELQIVLRTYCAWTGESRYCAAIRQQKYLLSDCIINETITVGNGVITWDNFHVRDMKIIYGNNFNHNYMIPIYGKNARVVLYRRLDRWKILFADHFEEIIDFMFAVIYHVGDTKPVIKLTGKSDYCPYFSGREVKLNRLPKKDTELINAMLGDESYDVILYCRSFINIIEANIPE